jgi:phage terminase large subunit-like protein
VTPFLAQAETFPTGTHDDMVDAVSGVYQMLAKGRCKVLVA